MVDVPPAPVAAGARYGTIAPSGVDQPDPFAALLGAGREIAAASTTTAVRQALTRAASAVLNADEAFVLDVRGGQPDVADLPPATGELCGRLVLHAVALGAAVTVGGAGARAALCVPVCRGGRAVAGMCALRPRARGGFTDEEQRLAGFLAALAGATLDHVAGAEAHFRALVRNSKDLTVVTDPGGRILYVSPSVSRLIGYSARELTTLGTRSILHGDDREKVDTAFQLIQFSPAAHPTVEVRARHRDGSWVWLEVTLTNQLAEPTIRGVVFNIRDVSDRKRAETALREATEQFRLSFENAPIGMALTSIDPASPGRFLRVNPALAEMLGYRRADLEGRTITELTHPEDHDSETAALARFQSGGMKSFAAVERYRHADGHWIWVQLRATVVSEDLGAPSYVITQMLDVTERRAAEERLTFLALHDPLTGLANRRLLFDRLSLALVRAERTGNRVAVFYVDLDGFKRVNDSLGHDRGDELLVQVAGRLSRLVRESDTLARLGGDEFVLVADDLTCPAQAALIALRIEGALEQPFDLAAGGPVTLGASVGVAVSSPGGKGPPAAAADALLRQADGDMYGRKVQRRPSRALVAPGRR